MATLTTEVIYAQADSYLLGTMPDLEQDQFELKLKTDSAFRELIKKYFTLKLALKLRAKEKLRAELAEDIAQYIKYNASVPSSN